MTRHLQRHHSATRQATESCVRQDSGSFDPVRPLPGLGLGGNRGRRHRGHPHDVVRRERVAGGGESHPSVRNQRRGHHQRRVEPAGRDGALGHLGQAERELLLAAGLR
jgi:hypothetical protein